MASAQFVSNVGGWMQTVGAQRWRSRFFAGLVKFVFDHAERHAFRSFGLPLAIRARDLRRAVEIVGGTLLMFRRCIVPATVLLGITMVVAIGSSGIGHGRVRAVTGRVIGGDGR
jgi:hypothetical protein